MFDGVEFEILEEIDYVVEYVVGVCRVYVV